MIARLIQIVWACGFFVGGCWLLWWTMKNRCTKEHISDLEDAVNWGCGFWLILFATFLLPMLILSF